MTTFTLEQPSSTAFRISPTRTLLMLYAFLAPLGNLVRFSDVEGSYGLTTLVLMLTVAINVLPGLRVAKRDQLLFSLLLLMIWTVVACFAAVYVFDALTMTVNFVFYILFTFAVYRVNWTVERAHKVINCFIIGGFISSTLTLIDFFGIVDVPHVNDGNAFYTATSLGAVLQASGPFARRSAMAAYFSLLIPLAVLMVLNVKSLSKSTKLFYILTSLTSFVALLLTHNRAGLLGPLIAIVIISISTARSPAKVLRLLGVAVIGIGLVSWLLATVFHSQWVVYEALLRLNNEPVQGSYVTEESDAIRLVLFQFVMSSLKGNPIGNGYSLLEGWRNPHADPHNIASQIIWAAGGLGIVWLVYFSVGFFRRIKPRFTKVALRDPFSRYVIVLTGSLLGFVTCGMMHQILGTGMAWLFLGMILKMSTALPPWQSGTLATAAPSEP